MDSESTAKHPQPRWRGIQSGEVQGMATVVSLRWEGEALILDSRIQRPNGEMRIVFRYQLIDSGRSIRAVEQIRGAGRDQDNVWIFERR